MAAKEFRGVVHGRVLLSGCTINVGKCAFLDLSCVQRFRCGASNSHGACLGVIGAISAGFGKHFETFW
jgi:hypothetical protein